MDRSGFSRIKNSGISLILSRYQVVPFPLLFLIRLRRRHLHRSKHVVMDNDESFIGCCEHVLVFFEPRIRVFDESHGNILTMDNALQIHDVNLIEFFDIWSF